MSSDQLLVEIAAGQGEPLTRLARRIPSYRSGRPCTLSCLVRWVLNGVQLPNGERVTLEAARLAGRWISTPGALSRFIKAQTPRFGDIEPVRIRTLNQRTKASARAARELKKSGI